MPLNGLGVYSRPVGTIAVENTTIEATKYNEQMADFEAALNAPRPVPLGGTGAATAGAARASLGVPGLSEANTFSGSNTFGAQANFNSPAVFNGPIRAIDGINVRAPDNRQIDIGYNTSGGSDSINPFIAWGDGGTTDRATAQANKDGLLLQFINGASLDLTSTPGHATLSGSPIHTDENNPTWDYSSARLPLAPNSVTSVIHNLNAPVVEYAVDLHCASDDAGWEAEDYIISFSGPGVQIGNSAMNMTRVKLLVGASIEILHEETQDPTAINLAKWQAVVRLRV